MRSPEADSVFQFLDDLVDPLEQLTRRGVAGLDREDLEVFVSRCGMVVARTEYLAAVALAALDSVSAGGTVGWMKRELKMSGGAAAERLRLARSLDEHPRTAALLSTGEISYEQAAIVARSTAEVAAKDAATVEARLLPAMGMDPDRLRHLAKGIVAQVDRDALRRDARRAWAKRGLHLGPDTDGVVRVNGYLTSEAAAHWRASTHHQQQPNLLRARLRAPGRHVRCPPRGGGQRRRRNHLGQRRSTVLGAPPQGPPRGLGTGRKRGRHLQNGAAGPSRPPRHRPERR